MGTPGSSSRLGTYPGPLSLSVTTPISAALRADGFGENPFYHCLVAEILPAPGQPQGKNIGTQRSPLQSASEVSPPGAQQPDPSFFSLSQGPVWWAMDYIISSTARGRDATFIWKTSM